MTAHARALWAALTLPGALLHELTHAIVAIPGADRVGIAVDPRGFDARCLVAWRDDAPRGVIAASALAPVAAGLLALAVAVWSWAAGVTTLPRSPAEWAWLSIVTMWWFVFVTPSASDLATARGESHVGD